MKRLNSSLGKVKGFHLPISVKYFRQTNDLNDLVAVAEKEEKQRSAKFVEYTEKVYKPSQTITFDRAGELLLYSCDTIKKSQVYLKYPFIMYDSLIPLAAYNFFVDPFCMTWQFRHGLFYVAAFCGWMPHYYYIKNLSKKIHKLYLLRGGKYCRVVFTEISGNEHVTWLTINDINLLDKEFTRYDGENSDFLSSEGQLKHDLSIELDYLVYFGAPVNNENFFLMKDSKVHQPEIFEQVLKGYNIDDSDYEINTEDNTRWLEPNYNF